jgi:FkbM family methyltransferase
MRPKNQIPAYRIANAVLRILLRSAPYSNSTEKIALWWGYRFQPKLGLVELRSGASVYLNANDHLQLLLYYLGTFEPHCLAVMIGRLERGQTLLDVGANIGLFSVEAARIGANVIAIEAAPHHADAIRASVRVNGFHQIEVVPFAVADTDGSAVLRLPYGGNHGSFTLGQIDGDHAIEVEVRTIDEIVGGRSIDFIKIDIEGSEYRALLGAKQIIARSKPAILIELNEEALQACGSSTRQVKELLSEYGYVGRIVSTNRVIGIEDGHVCDEALFLPV